MATANRYPLSTVDGKAIPLEVIKPLGVIRLPFTATAFNVQVLSDAYEDKILMLSSSEDCYLDFAAAPTSPVDDVVLPSMVFVPAGVLIACVTNSVYLNVIGVSTSGILHIQLVDTWAGLALETQINYR